MRKSFDIKHEEAVMSYGSNEYGSKITAYRNQNSIFTKRAGNRASECSVCCTNGERNANARWFKCSGYCADNPKRY